MLAHSSKRILPPSTGLPQWEIKIANYQWFLHHPGSQKSSFNPSE
jgi:hypothetical protein